MGKRTWGYVKLATLQLMFANEGMELHKDDNTEEYINAMPMAANQALGEIFITGMPLLRRAKILISEDVDAAALDASGVLKIPAGGGQVAVPMQSYWEDFRAVDEGNVWRREGGGRMERTGDYDLMGEDYLLIDSDTEAEYLVWYRAYPLTITNETEDSTELDMPEEAVDIMPLYMAGELYKDDDLTASVQFLNEFQQKLLMLQMSAGQKKPSASVGRVKNTTGWW